VSSAAMRISVSSLVVTLSFEGSSSISVQACAAFVGLPQVLGSGSDRYWWVWIIGWLEILSETGAESTIREHHYKRRNGPQSGTIDAVEGRPHQQSPGSPDGTRFGSLFRFHSP
jgi:hypothetical protein